MNSPGEDFVDGSHRENTVDFVFTINERVHNDPAALKSYMPSGFK